MFCAQELGQFQKKAYFAKQQWKHFLHLQVTWHGVVCMDGEETEVFLSIVKVYFLNHLDIKLETAEKCGYKTKHPDQNVAQGLPEAVADITSRGIEWRRKLCRSGDSPTTAGAAVTVEMNLPTFQTSIINIWEWLKRTEHVFTFSHITLWKHSHFAIVVYWHIKNIAKVYRKSLIKTRHMFTVEHKTQSTPELDVSPRWFLSFQVAGFCLSVFLLLYFTPLAS